MKKILIITLTTLALFALSSCGKKDETTATNTFSLSGSGS